MEENEKIIFIFDNSCNASAGCKKADTEFKSIMTTEANGAMSPTTTVAASSSST